MFSLAQPLQLPRGASICCRISASASTRFTVGRARVAFPTGIAKIVDLESVKASGHAFPPCRSSSTACPVPQREIPQRTPLIDALPGREANRSGTALPSRGGVPRERPFITKRPCFQESSTGFFLEPSIPYTSEALKKENVNKSLEGAAADQAVFAIQLCILNRMSLLAGFRELGPLSNGFIERARAKVSFRQVPVSRKTVHVGSRTIVREASTGRVVKCFCVFRDSLTTSTMYL